MKTQLMTLPGIEGHSSTKHMFGLNFDGMVQRMGWRSSHRYGSAGLAGSGQGLGPHLPLEEGILRIVL